MRSKLNRCDKLAIVIFLTVFNTQVSNAAVVVSGLVEVNLVASKNFSRVQSSDISVANVELAIDAELSKWVSTRILVHNKKSDTANLNLDEATITFGNYSLSSTSLVVGQQYLPFGFFETNMISKPFTLVVGETASNALTFFYDDNIRYSAYVFNGDVNLIDNNNGNNNQLDKFGINFGYVFEARNVLIDIGVSYINSIGESGRLSGIINNGGPSTAVAAGGVTKYIPGIASHFLLEWGTFTFIVDHVLATNEFASQEIRDAATAKPSALNIEFGLNVSHATTLAIGIQESVDLAKILPKIRVLFAMSHVVSVGTTISGEFRIDADYSKTEGGGDGDGNASAFTLQVSSEF